VASTTHPI